MQNAKSVLSVKFNSALPPEKLLNTCNQDLDVFRDVSGLIQKYYIAEENTGAISGIYLFESKAAREAFWNSGLAKEIPARYEVIPGTLRVEQYDMAIVLNDLEVAG
jgi:Putative mono-oxygenase ydhR